MYSRIAVLLLGLACLGSISMQAQTLEPMPCNNEVTTNPSTRRGGRYITAQGALNVLFIYVQFPDNQYSPSNPNWPKDQPPAYMNATVDEVWSPTPTSGGFTDYFSQMSFDSLRVTGRSVSVITPHSRSWYLQNQWQAGAIHREVIQQLDQTTDFAEFDHWRFNSEYNLTNSPDTTVDMIFMMWRDIASDLPNWQQVQDDLNLRPGGYASLGGGPQFFVDNGARRIKTGYGIGSGVTNIFGRNSGLDSWTIWTTARHEFGHWLLGGNEYHTQLGTWGILNGFGAPSGCMNSFERERLAWINFNTIDDITTPRTISNVTLPDFVATGIAYRIKIPGGGTDEWYLLENHQRTSVFDIPDNNVASAKGLFVLYQAYDLGGAVGMVSAQGRFNWTVPYWLPNIYGSGSLPVFQRGTSNRVGGYDKRQAIPWQGQSWPIHYHLDYVTGALHQAPPTIFTGDGQDQFDSGYNVVFSPASNPSSDIHNNGNKIGFEITSVNNGVAVLNIHINTTESASPSKPQDLQVGLSGAQPRLTWAQMGEPDLQSGGSIHVERRTKPFARYPWYGFPWTAWSEIGTATGTATEYIDYTIIQGCYNCPDSVQYRLRAEDSTHRYSVYSDPAGTSYYYYKQAVDESIPEKFELVQNYPNPFNPTTTLNFDIPNDEFVSLKVFDVLGREVQTLVNELKKAGSYKIAFDASKLSSGVYLYKLQAGSFTAAKKMLLAK